MGNQGYSNEGTRQAAEMIWSGEIGNVTEVHAWTDRPIWPQGLTEIPAARCRARHARLGPVARHRREAALHFGRQGLSDQYGATSISRSTGAASTISAAARWATWPATFWRAEHGAAARRSDQRGVHPEGRHQRLHVPEGVGDPVRLSRARQHASGEALLARRPEGDSPRFRAFRRASFWAICRASAAAQPRRGRSARAARRPQRPYNGFIGHVFNYGQVRS